MEEIQEEVLSWVWWNLILVPVAVAVAVLVVVVVSECYVSQ